MLADPEDGLGIKVMFLKHSSIRQWRMFTANKGVSVLSSLFSGRVSGQIVRCDCS